jgi:O-antigen ligase
MPRQHQQPAFSAVMRLSYWKDTLALVPSHPLFGVGPGNFNLPQTRYAHNSFLQFLAETGILGLGALLWLLTAVVTRGRQQIRSAEQPLEGLCIAGAVSVFLVHNLVDFTFFLPEISHIWWLLLGLLL